MFSLPKNESCGDFKDAAVGKALSVVGAAWGTTLGEFKAKLGSSATCAAAVSESPTACIIQISATQTFIRARFLVRDASFCQAVL